MRLPEVSFSDHRKSQTSGPRLRLFLIRLPRCIFFLLTAAAVQGRWSSIKMAIGILDDHLPCTAAAEDGRRLRWRLAFSTFQTGQLVVCRQLSACRELLCGGRDVGDRKSTRLNSSH